MNKYLPIFIALLIVLSLGVLKLTNALAQDSDLQTSDYALDVAQGEKDTANDVDAQNNQQGVNQDEEVQAVADDGDSSTEPVAAALDEMIAPEEAHESAKLVDNPQATNSENDNGEILKDQSTQSPDEKVNEDVNTQDDNKAPLIDSDTKPQDQPAPQEQPLENLQNIEPQDQDQQTIEQPQPIEKSSEGSDSSQ